MQKKDSLSVYLNTKAPREVKIGVDKVIEEVPMDLDNSEGQSGMKSTPKDVAKRSSSDESSDESDKVQCGMLSTPKGALVNESSSDEGSESSSGGNSFVSSTK